jgi:hypothetical protein
MSPECGCRVRIVTRVSRVRVPGGSVELSTMPMNFDLVAFDQMFRSGGTLTRWIEAPRLIVQSLVLQFTTSSATEFRATGDTMTDGQQADLVSTLVAALPALTGGRFTAFASQTVETAGTGDNVAVTRSGAVFVAHFKGLTTSSSSAGFGRWSTDSRSAVRAGVIMLDRDYDLTNSRRRMTRIHELGHALGYNHVMSRESVMNSPSLVEPTSWDREAARVAFQREPGSRSSDNDPAWFTSNPLAREPVVWSAPVP